MGMFDDLVQQKKTQQKTVGLLRTRFNEGQDDIVSHQLAEEKKYYEQMSQDKQKEEFSEIERLSSLVFFETPQQRQERQMRRQSKKLAPRIDESGMSEKRREKVKNRTVNNWKEGKELVGEMATTQTIPLMRSMKKNAKTLAKKKEKEKADIIKLSKLNIPSDIFDLTITKEHSHFDVKKAMAIRDSLDSILKYKENNPVDYCGLDLNIYAKLEYLLDMKDAFDKTFKVALAANGLSETGEPLEEKEMKAAREDYAPVTEAFREVMDQKDQLMQQKSDELLTMRQEREQRFLCAGTYLKDRKEKQKFIFDNWSSFVQAVPKEQQFELPAGFMTSQFADRVVYRLDLKDDKACIAAMRVAVDSYILGLQTDPKLVEEAKKEEEANKPGEATKRLQEENKKRDEVFARVKEQALPLYRQHLKELYEWVDKAMDGNIEDVLKDTEKLLEFEMPSQHFSDICNCKDSKGNTIKALLNISEDEWKLIKNCNTLTSFFRKKVVLTNAYRAAKAGIKMDPKQLDENINRVSGEALNQDGTIDMKKMTPLLERELNTATERVDFLSGLVRKGRSELQAKTGSGEAK